MKRRGLVPLVASLLLVLTAWLVAGRPVIWREADAPREGLTELRGVEELQARFNADAGMARLILILSPT